MKLMQNFRNDKTGEVYYKPIDLSLLNIISRFRAFVRVRIWGVCPSCNSDAPKLYDCELCKHDTKSPFDRGKRKEYWNRWKLLDFYNKNLDSK
jgi:predicted amidophosphoribosyltransferase